MALGGKHAGVVLDRLFAMVIVINVMERCKKMQEEYNWSLKSYLLQFQVQELSPDS